MHCQFWLQRLVEILETIHVSIPVCFFWVEFTNSIVQSKYVYGKSKYSRSAFYGLRTLIAKTIGEANGSRDKVAKGLGATNWHSHADQDELFIVYKGQMTIQLRDRNMELCEDEMFIVPRDIEHCPVAEQEVEFLLVGINITSNAAGGNPNL